MESPAVSFELRSVLDLFHKSHIERFLSLLSMLSFQGSMTVTEYRDRFLQLARYAPADVARDSDKQEYFKEGLDDHIQYALLNHRFDNFNQLVDAALNTECKRREIEDKKRKMASSSSGSNTRPRYQHP
jgi:hypothetical protein